MSSRKAIVTEVQDVWTKLNAKWTGDDANAFQQQYIVKISETTELFENACADLVSISTEFAKELQLIEHSLAN